MLCWPSRSRWSVSSLLPGGTSKSSNLPAECSIASFFLAASRRFAGGIPWLLPVSQNSFVPLSAKVLITFDSLTYVVNNVKRYYCLGAPLSVPGKIPRQCLPCVRLL